MRHDAEVFDSPLNAPDYLLSRTATETKKRTRSPTAITLGVVLATGLSVAVVQYTDGATRSRGVAQVFLGAQTESRWIDPLVLPEDEKLTLAWHHYLRDLGSVVGSPFARKVRQFWTDLEKEADFEVPPPHAGPTEQESFVLSWDRGGQYCEVEMFFDGHFEWFYCNRQIDDFEGSEGGFQQAVAATEEYLLRLLAV